MVAVACVVVALPGARAGAQGERPAVPGVDSCPHALVPVPELRAQTARSAMRCLLHAHREASGLRPLQPSAPLRRVALALARDQLARGYRGHVSPAYGDLRARAIRQWLRPGERRRWQLAEAIAWGTRQYTTPAALLETLLRSPAHRRLLRDRRFRLGDVGLAGSGDSAVAVVELARLR